LSPPLCLICILQSEYAQKRVEATLSALEAENIAKASEFGALIAAKDSANSQLHALTQKYNSLLAEMGALQAHTKEVSSESYSPTCPHPTPFMV